MGNTCPGSMQCPGRNPCPWRPTNDANANVIEIVVKDTSDATIQTVQVNAGRITTIRFILPIIKLTDENNREFLIFNPEEISSKRMDSTKHTKTIVIASEVRPNKRPKLASLATSEDGHF